MELEQLRNDMIVAMKQKDKARKEAISALVAAVKKVGIDEGCREDIPSEIVDRVMLKELKTVKEQLESCPPDRTDLLEQYQFTYDVVSEYAPQMMTEEEVKAVLEKKFSEVIATKNKGMIMKAVMAELKGKADGKIINQVVAQLTQ